MVMAMAEGGMKVLVLVGATVMAGVGTGSVQPASESLRSLM